MSIDSSIVPEIKISPPDGELLYVDPYIREKADIDVNGNVQIIRDYPGLVWDGSKLVYDSFYSTKYNVGGALTVSDEPAKDIEISIDTINTYIEPIAPIESSDLKNTYANIRKIKPDINSKLKKA